MRKLLSVLFIFSLILALAPGVFAENEVSDFLATAEDVGTSATAVKKILWPAVLARPLEPRTRYSHPMLLAS